MITTAFVDYNGVVVEKYDVTRTVDPHKVDAEYDPRLALALLPSKDPRSCVQNESQPGAAALQRLLRFPEISLLLWQSQFALLQHQTAPKEKLVYLDDPSRVIVVHDERRNSVVADSVQ
jgi:hypothetical protein